MTNIRRIAMVFALLGCAPSALAQQALPPEWDTTLPVRLTGTISGVQWTNPLAWVHVLVQDAGATAVPQEYAVALVSVAMLTRLGWSRDAFKEGERVTVEGYRSRDRADHAIARLIVTADGRTLFDRTGITYAPNGADLLRQPER